MPGMDGPALLAEIKVRYPQLPVIVMTAYSTVKNAVQSMRNGAYDYIAKPFDIDELDITVAKALQFRDIMRDNARMRAELDEHAQFDSLVGDSPAFRRVLHAVDSVRDSNDIDLPAYLFASTPAEDGVGAILSNGPGVPQDLDAALAEVEKAYIMAALQESNGVQAAAAQKIGISERSFWYRLKKLGIQVDKIVR
eukprot:gene21587-25626_t